MIIADVIKLEFSFDASRLSSLVQSKASTAKTKMQ